MILAPVLVLCLLPVAGLSFPSGPPYSFNESIEKAVVFVDPTGFGQDPSMMTHGEQLRILRIRSFGSQARIVRFLETETKLGRVKQFRCYWVTNAIWVEAERSVIRHLTDFYEVTRIVKTDNPHRVFEYYPGEEANDNFVERGTGVMEEEALWSLGLTGLGTLVCIIDTGVDGNHPAFSERWRGTLDDVDWSEAWFDPVGGTEFPVDDDNHGTFMTGLVLGREGSDTTGVAPDAQWIAARALGGDDFIADILSSLQWAFDPDGDPETYDDVPDVLPLTWTFFGTCDDLLWEAIDNLESTGVVVITSVGAYGPGSGTVGSPADRIESSVNCFSIGTIDGWNPEYPLAYFSGRGPSSCDGQTIKPEVVAPGINERSSVAGGGYEIWSGTSLSTAIVAGGVLLLEQAQAAPDGEQIKESLLGSATDLGSAGEDNSYGWGLVNLPGALEELGGLTEVIFDLEPEHSTYQPGDSAYIDFELKNLTSFPQNFQAFLGVRPPVGDGFILNQKELTLGPVAAVSGTLPLYIPLKAPAGDYALIGMAATMSPFSVIDSDTVVVSITEGR